MSSILEENLAALESMVEELLEYSRLFEAAVVLRSTEVRSPAALILARRKLDRIEAAAAEMDRFKRARRENGQFAPVRP